MTLDQHDTVRKGSANKVIVGHGIDLVSLGRIAAAAERHPERFARRILADEEFADYQARGAKVRDLAKYFAVKEAASKALGTGMGAGVYWPQMVLRRKPVSGAPLLFLSGAAVARLQKIGGGTALVSLADEGDLVIASVVIAARTE